jgi:Tfp pilus assembly protein PilV
MSRIPKGMGLVEVMVAMFLATVAVISVFSLQAPGLRTTARSDYFGRAAEILERQLESTEVYLMNSCNTVADANVQIPAMPAAPGTVTNSAYDVRTSGLAVSITGDASYHVSTTITGLGTTVPPNYFRVDVKVTWSLNIAGGISQTIFVSRQEFFKLGLCS